MGLDGFFFLNDDGVCSVTKKQHWEHLQALFSILVANGLDLILEKCEFAATELHFLCHSIFSSGLPLCRGGYFLLHNRE